MGYSFIWDLESIFSDGSQSKQLRQRMENLKQEINQYQILVTNWKPNQDLNYENLLASLSLQAIIKNSFSQCHGFINGLLSANTRDSTAQVLSGDLFAQLPSIQLADTILIKKLSKISDKEWQMLLSLEYFQLIAFRLSELRHTGKLLLSEKEENIINTLFLDGLNAWSSHYESIVSSIEIPFKKNDDTFSLLSTGQAYNRMMSNPNKLVRAELFKEWEKAWQAKASLFANTLNHLAGFRLSNYRLHGIDNFLEQPLYNNRMKPETLDMMWETIQKNKQPFIDYLTRKAQLLGKEKMEWQDQDAPISLGNTPVRTFSFDEAAAFILRNFEKFSPKMARFSKTAFEKSWIEAEDRPAKSSGAYCTDFPEANESRIFMTFGGSVNEVTILAHELGHAFHSSVMWDLPTLNQEYAMNVAETASTFAELIVMDAALKEAITQEEKINLLDTKIKNAITMFFNIHTRFIFENNFYEKRKKGIVSEKEITELMLEAQKESYLESLGNYHPHFWATKVHFFFDGVLDDIPFFNFPYTFGYLFSMGIYTYARKQGTSFEEQYINILRDTGSMTSEDLAKKHLNVDLTQAGFWQNSINQVLKDVDEFMILTDQYLEA